jgi:putative membrane protein
MEPLPGMDDSRPRRPRWVYQAGSEPDPRFSLANERTLLSWIRTSTGFAAAGGGLLLVRNLLGRELSLVLSVSAFGLSLAIIVGAVTRWAVTERALRLDRALPSPTMAFLVGGAVMVGAIVGVAYDLFVQ